jgi:hypothetical protein
MSYTDRIREDMLPLLVLDASAKIRKTYEAMENRGWNLKYLRSSEKDYSNVTFEHASVPTGVDAWSANMDKYSNYVASKINSNPQEKWLIIYKKRPWTLKNRDEWQDTSVATLIDPEIDCKFVYWGSPQAKADNSLRDRTAVIVLTPFYLPAAVNKANYAGSRGDDITGQTPRDFILGEIYHDLHQAIHRTSMRKSVNGKAPAVRVYTMASPQDAIPQYFRETYGAKVSISRELGANKGIPKKLQERRETLLAFVKANGKVKTAELYEHLELSPNAGKKFLAANKVWFESVGIVKSGHSLMLIGHKLF